ncbi:hypothetical protein VC566_06835 [Citrobacter freundii]|nr:hypothetical protein [Citrobacter freundii]
MNSIYDDETICSYLFRCLNAYGINSYEFVIGSNGCWHSLPVFPNTLAPLLRLIPDMKLFRSLQREGYYRTTHVRKSNPREIIDLMKKVYGGSSSIHKYKGTDPILYCPSCFKEMIIKYGHAYFLSAWKGEVNCIFHQLPLLILTGRNMNETVRNIKHAMAEIDLSNYSGEIKNNAIANINIESFINPEDLIFSMPCTYKAVYFLVREYYSFNSKALEFKSYLYDRMFYSSLSPKMEGINLPLMKNVDDNVIYAAFEKLIELDYNVFASFVKHGLQFKRFPLGFNQNKSISVTIVKNANENCSKCHMHWGERHCVYEPIIKKERLEPILNCLNICEQRLIWGKDFYSLLQIESLWSYMKTPKYIHNNSIHNMLICRQVQLKLD